MKCPKCGSEMRREGFARVSGEKVIVTFACPSCHARIEVPASKQKTVQPNPMKKRRLFF